MPIWISKVLFAALASGLIAGCDEQEMLAFAPEIGRPAATRSVPEPGFIELAGGDIRLTAPPGYCIDRRSVNRAAESSFALIARCDTLGAKGNYSGSELALITVTTAPRVPGAAAPSARDLARSAARAEVLESQNRRGLALVRLATGSSSLPGVSAQHWRGAFVVNGHVVGLNLYAPESSPALGAEGARLLSVLAERTLRNSTPAAPAKQTDAKIKA